MMAPIPENEAERIRALRELNVLDTPPEQVYDDLAGLAARVCRTPMAMLSLVDADRQWFKAKKGIEASETPRDQAFCAHAILNPSQVMVVPDARRDRRFADNALVTQAPGIRFYAGAPLVALGGEALGTLCVMDREPRELAGDDIEALRALARQAMAQLEMRRGESMMLRAELEKARRAAKELEARLARQEMLEKSLREEHSFRHAVIDRAAEGVCVCHAIPASPFVEFTVWNQQMIEITGYAMEDINRLGWYQTVYPDLELRERAIARMERMRTGDDLRDERWEIMRADGQKRAVRISTSLLTAADGQAHVLAMMHDATEEEQLTRAVGLARQDALTGVKTLRAFREEAAILFRLAARTGAPIALGFMDLDGFKAVNDTKGHAEGDRVLECVGSILSQSTRSTDVVGRVGGDEFAILLPETDAGSVEFFFNRLHQRLVNAMRDRAWPVGASIGVGMFPPLPQSEHDALRYADRLMYRAKSSGKNHVVYEKFPGSQ